MPPVSRNGSTKEGDGTEPFSYSLKIGFFAGMIWGLIRWLAFTMNFTKVAPAFLADPWAKRSVLLRAHWQIAGLVLFVLMSLFAAIVYWMLLRKFRGPWAGLMFGIAWWAIFYIGVGPMIGAVPPLVKVGWNSILTDLCLFSVWGVFIGFSIAFEFHNEAKREPEPAGA